MRWGALLAVVLLILGGCANPPAAERPQLERYTVRGGAIEAEVPRSWGTVFVWLPARPVGLGLLVADETRPDARLRFAVSASSVALRETPASFPATHLHSFPRSLLTARPDFQIDWSDCATSVIRPISSATLFGELRQREGCDDGASVSQVVAMDAARTVLVTIEARGHRGESAASVVEAVLSTLEVDPLALPVQRRAEPEVVRVEE